MFLQWTLFLSTGNVPELETEPIEIRFHLAAEILTATLLVVAGLALFANQSWAIGVYLVAIGMLFYTSIQSPGYFAQQGRWIFIGMFIVLFVLSLVSLVLLLNPFAV